MSCTSKEKWALIFFLLKFFELAKLEKRVADDITQVDDTHLAWLKEAKRQQCLGKVISIWPWPVSITKRRSSVLRVTNSQTVLISKLVRSTSIVAVACVALFVRAVSLGIRRQLND